MKSLNTKVVFFLTFFYSLFFSILSAQAQQVVTGRITDAEDGMPVPGASIFIANTTVGTTSGESGNYSLTVPGTGSFEIVVSHVGYQSVFHKIDTPKDFHQYNVELETNEMQEVTITALKNYRRRDVDLFWEKILGEKPSKRGMEVLNPEKVYYYLNSDNVLKVTCKEPIEIVNHQTGYHIRYILQSFEHNYRNNETMYYGMPHFEELIPRDSRQNTRWEKKRQEVYSVSITHFIRSLYRKQIHEEGFLLINRDSLMKMKTSPVLLKDIAQADQDLVSVNIEVPLFLMCFSEPVTDNMIQKSYTVLYGRRFRYPVVVVLPPQQISIYSDGTYAGLLKISEDRNNSLTGLTAMLPVEYHEPAQTTQNLSYGHTVLPSYDLLMVEENLTAQLEAYPQEKIHVHTDRDFYVPGEKIWFKAYIVDAHSHQYPTYSEYVYVELISPEDTLVNRVMIGQTDDMFYGHLPLSDMVPGGNYTLRAYTRYMENLGDDYFFKKNIRIGNLMSNKNQQPQTTQRSRNRRALTVTETDDFDVSFFPEGGNLPEGVMCNVAFKAINKNGYPETVSGKITDENGAAVISVETRHAGMGIFTYVPVSGKKYYLNCVNGNGTEKRFELPQPNSRAWSLTASIRNKTVFIGIQKSVHAPEIPCYLLVHCRGNVIYFLPWDNKYEAVSLPEEKLPAGVIQFVLFDGQMNPLSERLMFSKNDASANVDFHTDKEVYEKRDKIVATLELDSTPRSLPVGEGWGGASLSIAVTDDKDIAVDESTTILSSLLLSSELKGYIENPAYYLQDDVAMDLLMMTHGWRRYNIPEVVKGNLESPQIPFQIFQELSGQVKTLNTNSRPVSDSEILITMKGGGVGLTSTDRNGSFIVPELVFPDSTTFFVQAFNSNGRDNVQLDMNHELFPELVYAPQSPIPDIPLTVAADKDEPDVDAFLEKAEQRAKFDEYI